MWEIREKGENSQNQNKSSAFKTERRNQEKTCFKCGKPGHLKYNCKSTWTRGSFGRSGADGGAYWQGGVRQSQQQQLHRGDSGRGRGGRGYGQRSLGGGRGMEYRGERGYGWQQRNEGNRQPDATYRNSESNRENIAGLFYTEVEVKSESKNTNVEANSCNNNRID